jgi:hypothetical protein
MLSVIYSDQKLKFVIMAYQCSTILIRNCDISVQSLGYLFININIYNSSSISVFYTIACSWDFFSASILRQMKSESTHALTLPEINLLSKTSSQPADHSAYIVDKVLQMEL